ncbi:MAG: NTP transferase domain-containing protein, partial [Oscillospiraceae bacterium]|nr:NTP transferase domain-containing protein [Oscillospiraceae bacterium]
MKTVILAGGYGMRIAQDFPRLPKPMVAVGAHPILWHIMKIYSAHGHNEFIICAGYMQQVIKDYFANYELYRSDVTFDFTSENALTI